MSAAPAGQPKAQQGILQLPRLLPCPVRFRADGRWNAQPFQVNGQVLVQQVVVHRNRRQPAHHPVAHQKRSGRAANGRVSRIPATASPSSGRRIICPACKAAWPLSLPAPGKCAASPGGKHAQQRCDPLPCHRFAFFRCRVALHQPDIQQCRPHAQRVYVQKFASWLTTILYSSSRQTHHPRKANVPAAIVIRVPRDFSSPTAPAAGRSNTPASRLQWSRKPPRWGLQYRLPG